MNETMPELKPDETFASAVATSSNNSVMSTISRRSMATSPSYEPLQVLLGYQFPLEQPLVELLFVEPGSQSLSEGSPRQ